MQEAGGLEGGCCLSCCMGFCCASLKELDSCSSQGCKGGSALYLMSHLCQAQL